MRANCAKKKGQILIFPQIFVQVFARVYNIAHCAPLLRLLLPACVSQS
jgi:hypothetical protein